MLPPFHESVPLERGAGYIRAGQQDRDRRGGAGGMNLSSGAAVAGRSLADEAAWQSDSAKGRALTGGVRAAEQSWSFERIYDEYKTPIYNYVYHLVGNREQADDLALDTFLKAVKDLLKMGANLQLSVWVY